MSKYTRCPDCERKGVYMRLRKNGEDNMGCKYCGFYFFISGDSPMDRGREGRWRELNPDQQEL